MGKSNSKWRDNPASITTWNAEARKKLLELIKTEGDTLRRMFGQKIENLQIILLGDTGSGKSSVINTLNTAIVQDQRVSYLATAASNPKQATRHYTPYQLQTDDREHTLPFKITDFRGFGSKESGASDIDVSRAIRGLIEAESRITGGNTTLTKDEMDDDPSKYAFSILLVVDVRVVSGLSPDAASAKLHERLSTTIETAYDLNLPVAVILTHCDMYDEFVKQNTERLHSSDRVRDAVSEASAKLGIPPQRIFPVVNYTGEQVSSPQKAIQILLPVYYLLGDLKQRLKHKYPDFVASVPFQGPKTTA